MRNPCRACGDTSGCGGYSCPTCSTGKEDHNQHVCKCNLDPGHPCQCPKFIPYNGDPMKPITASEIIARNPGLYGRNPIADKLHDAAMLEIKAWDLNVPAFLQPTPRQTWWQRKADQIHAWILELIA